MKGSTDGGDEKGDKWTVAMTLKVAVLFIRIGGERTSKRNMKTIDIYHDQLPAFGLAYQWRHNERDGVSYHQPHDCLLNRLFRRRSKKTSKLRVTVLCAENSPVTGEFSTQMASNAKNVSIWWRRHEVMVCGLYGVTPLPETMLTHLQIMHWDVVAVKLLTFKSWHLSKNWLVQLYFSQKSNRNRHVIHDNLLSI